MTTRQPAMKQLLLILSIILSVSLFPPAQAAAKRVYLDITSAETRKIQFAIPRFQNSASASDAKLDRGLADTLAKALVFHGIIDVLPNQQVAASTNGDWARLGADYGVVGRYSVNKDQLNMEIRLFDAAEDKMLMGKAYKGPLDEKDLMLYKFTDAVINELTGTPGLATTQIGFITQPADKREREVFITDILGRKTRQITRHRNLVVSPRFSPDGVNMAYTSYHSGNQNLYITDLRQSKTTRVISRRKGMNLAPAWSPDGQSMVVTLSFKGNPDLYLINRRGEILRQLTKRTGINVSPSFSPDGRHIVFVSDRSGKPQLYMMELVSGNTQRLTFEGVENAEPSWSPVENLVVYSSLRGGIYHLCTIDPFNIGSSTQITSDQTHHETPSWSPDGNQIIFAKRDGRDHKLYGIMKNGLYQRMLFSLPGSQTYPRWAVKPY
ncbi:MAG: Tol-Pal system beta propeller repeat protein TolB [Desulfobulbaceae bacterium]|nr:MAG: Tol-Pal system beta propeller repeat protein TolB [Desulfobulbaceae bacterium]